MQTDPLVKGNDSNFENIAREASTPSSQEVSICEGVSHSIAVISATANSPNPDGITAITSQPSASSIANWSTGLQTVLDQPPSNLPQKLILGGTIFCLVFGAWAWLGKIEQVGHARGQLVPKGDVYKIHPVELGKVIHIAVKEGQVVKAGQMIVEMDTQLERSDVERLQKLLTADELQLNQMQASIDRTRLEAKTRKAVAVADLQAQAAAIAQAQKNAATTRQLLAQLQADAVTLQARRDRLRPFIEKGAIARDRLFEAEQSLSDRQRNITQNQGELQQALTEANRLQAQLNQKQAESHIAQLESQERIQQLGVEMTKLKGKIAETKNLLNSAKTKLTQKFLYAPVNGFISSLNLRNIGEVVQPGQTIAEVAPYSAPLILSASLPNQEAGFVKRGMPVQVKFDAYPYQDYGIVPGKVISISSDAKPDEQLGAVYRVEVALERNYVTANYQTIYFRAGQTAAAEIVIRRRRVADILLEPIKQLQKGGINL
ncbi:HlyD family efflux transporter periplasmic adaptor subunit [Chroococcidiopsis sp. FACHB-1243]|uniref:HlyD family efflux transporter periplasmic adaptor subunit n=1 Tax=Chroococcidiopsis sp. [FACHB-1243] TaxID=2692781 RepID=UPI001780E31E|nr:HlyD family efflux transporter periplasmic adaptor subunit [Chroococcidiopsis sp. [FACHB-1243]]MBD2308083.1 HlyD family efflux transporter periplasmic adaptor subunit [Chroococcidiopsis sp. [FACHB-1243]]